MRTKWAGVFLCVAGLAFAALQGTDVPAGLSPAGSGVQAPAGTWTVKGAGADIWGASDQFYFLYDTAVKSGDFAISCHVVSFNSITSTWGKGGLMARVPQVGDPLFLGPEAYSYACVSMGNGICHQYRDAASGNANDTQDAGEGTRLGGVRDNMWLKLVREGNTISAYTGPVKGAWTPLGAHPNDALVGIDMHVGLAVTSHTAGELATAVFDNVDLNDNVPVVGGGPTNLACVVNGTNVNLTWTNNSAYTSLTLVRQSASGAATVVTPGPGLTDEAYTDTPPDGSYKYYIVTKVAGGECMAPPYCAAAVSTGNHGFLDANGFFLSWLLLGPLSKTGGCSPAVAEQLGDYLANADGSITQDNVLPEDKDIVSPNFGGNALNTTAVQGPEANGQNPNAAAGEAAWALYHAPTDTIDHATFYGQEPDEHMVYHVTYLQNSGAARLVIGGVASDDAIIVVLDNSVLWQNPVCRGYGAAGAIQDRFAFILPTGEHRLMVKVFDGTGGSGFRMRLEEVNGTPITTGIGLKFVPTMTSVPAEVPAVSALACTVTATNVQIQWTNPIAYDEIAVFRRNANGTMAQVPGVTPASTSATDSIPMGLATYFVVARKGNVASSLASCTVRGRALLDGNGYLLSWLILGPLAQPGGADPGNPNRYRDYLATVDGTTEANVLPEDGMEMEVDFGGAAASTSFEGGAANPGTPATPTNNNTNPRAAEGIGAWKFFESGATDGFIYLNDVWGGVDYDQLCAYGVCYIQNTTGAPLLVNAQLTSDDTCVWLLDAALVGTTYWNNHAELSFPMLIPPGEHRFMGKDFEGNGGNDFRMRLQDPVTGLPILGNDARIIFRTAPASMTSVPTAPLIAVTRTLPPTMFVNVEGTVTITVANGSANVFENVPANMTITDRGTGGGAGQQITWTNVTGALTYKIRPTAEGGTFIGYDQEVPGGGWVTTQGPNTAIFPKKVGDWYSADLADPGHKPSVPSSLTVNGTTLTIKTSLGDDIWNTADECHLVWQPFNASSNFAIQARLDQFNPLRTVTQQWSKAGIMFRTYPTQGSPYVFGMFRSDAPFGTAVPDWDWQWRDASDAGAGNLGTTDELALPQWIRLVYMNGRLTGYHAPDDGAGAPGAWVATPEHVLNLEGQTEVLAGFAVTTHEAAVLESITAIFSNVEIVSLDAALTNLTAAFEGDNVNLTWANSGVIDGIKVRRVVVPDLSGLGLEEIADLAGTATSYTDTTVPAGAIVVDYVLSISTQGVEIPGASAGAVRAGYRAFQEGSVPSAAYTGCQDTHIIYYDHGDLPNYANNWNMGGHTHIEEGDWDGGHFDHKEILLQFDIPGVSAVTEAALWLYYDYQRNANIAAQDHESFAMPLLKSWNEGTGLGVDGRLALPGEATWTSAKNGESAWQRWDTLAPADYACSADLPVDRSGGAYGPEDVNISLAVASNIQYGTVPLTWVSWDVTDIVAAWAGGTLANNGFKISQQGAANSPCMDYVAGGYDFASSNNPSVPLRPILIVRTEGVSEVFVLMGDCNGDGGVNIADAIYLLGYLFGGKPAPLCAKTADANNDGNLNIADAIAILGYLFGGKTMTAPDGTILKSPENPTSCKGYPANLIPATIGNPPLPGCGKPCK